MRFRKVYGQSKMDECPFCGTKALSKNPQGVPVCSEHRKTMVPELKCACGSWLDLRDGKFGPFFSCISCGAISFSKAKEMNSEKFLEASQARQTGDVGIEKEEAEKKEKKKVRQVPYQSPYPKGNSKEITVTSDELDFMY